jgi:hypothetical protein
VATRKKVGAVKLPLESIVHAHIEMRAGDVGLAVIVQGPTSKGEKRPAPVFAIPTVCPIAAVVTLNVIRGSGVTLKLENETRAPVSGSVTLMR